MESEQTFWTILLTYSFIQGYLLAVYAFFVLRRPFLSVLLAAISTLICAHLYYYFYMFAEYPHFIFAEASLWYLIGPLFYLFILRLFEKSPGWSGLLHFIPFVAFLLFIAPFYFESGPDKVKILGSVFNEINYQGDVNRIIFSAHLFVYIVFSYRTFNRESRKLKESSSQSTLILDSMVSILLKYYLLFSFLGFLVYLAIGSSYRWYDLYYVSYYVGLSLLIHLLFYYSLVRADSGARKPVDSLTPDSEKYRSSTLTSEDLTKITEKVVDHLSRHEVYRNPELRLRMISEDLNIPAHHISQAINQNLNKTFFDLVNEQRIAGMKMHMDDPQYRNYTLAGIATEHGFKSSSSFFRVVKKYTGQTPGPYFGNPE